MGGVNFEKETARRVLAATQYVEQKTRTGPLSTRSRRPLPNWGSEITVWYGKAQGDIMPNQLDAVVEVWSGEQGEPIAATGEMLEDCHWEIPADGVISDGKWVEVIEHDGVLRVFPLECE